MSEQPKLSRDDLIEVIARVRWARYHRVPHEELLETLEQSLPDSDVRDLCGTDLPEETVVDYCLGLRHARRNLTRPEMVELVRAIQEPSGTEAEHLLLVETFVYNCRHPAGTDLIFYPDEVFGHDQPTAEKVVERALRGE